VDEPNRIVASGYDRIAETYEAWMGLRASPNTAPAYYRRFLDECLDLIPPGGLVLDLGCGAGRVAAEIGKRARVVGVDISIAQIRLARERVPTGAFLVADMAKLEFRSGSFDAMAAFYSVIHVRRDLTQDFCDLCIIGCALGACCLGRSAAMTTPMNALSSLASRCTGVTSMLRQHAVYWSVRGSGSSRPTS
jgi:SAM-dependent methyltransferase